MSKNLSIRIRKALEVAEAEDMEHHRPFVVCDPGKYAAPTVINGVEVYATKNK